MRNSSHSSSCMGFLLFAQGFLQLENVEVCMLVHPMDMEQGEFRRFEMVPIDRFRLQAYSLGKVFWSQSLLYQFVRRILSMFRCSSSCPPTAGVTLRHPSVRVLFRNLNLRRLVWRASSVFAGTHFFLVIFSNVEMRSELLQQDFVRRLLIQFFLTLHGHGLAHGRRLCSKAICGCKKSL